MRRKITKVYVKLFNSTGRFKNILKVFEQFFLVSEAKITGFVTPCRKLVASFFLGITDGGGLLQYDSFFQNGCAAVLSNDENVENGSQIGQCEP